MSKNRKELRGSRVQPNTRTREGSMPGGRRVRGTDGAVEGGEEGVIGRTEEGKKPAGRSLRTRKKCGVRLHYPNVSQ